MNTPLAYQTDRLPPRLRYALGFLLLSAFLLGLYSVLTRYFIFTDGTAYATLGENLAKGAGLKVGGAPHVFYPPGYPMAIGTLYLFLRDSELAGHLVSLLAYLGTTLLTARLAWSLRPSIPFVILSTLLVVIHLSMILYSSFVMAEGAFVCTVTAAALCCWQLASRSRTPAWMWGAWGALIGYAYLIRADGVLYGPLQFGFLLLGARENRAALLPKSLLALAALLLVMGPYLIFVKQVTGKWQLSTKTAVILEYSRQQMMGRGGLAESKHGSQLSKDGKSFTVDTASDTLGAYLLREPKDAARRVLRYSRELLSKPGVTFGWINLPFFLILLLAKGRGILNRKTLFVLLHLFPIALFLVLYIDARFLLTFIPVFALGIGRAAEQLGQWTSLLWKRTYPLYVYALMALLLLAGGLYAGPKIVKRGAAKVRLVMEKSRDLPREHRAMGQWMKENLEIGPTTRISHRNPWVSFYAGGCHARTPYTGDLDVLENWARETNTEYLLVDERMTKPYMPVLAFLLDDSKEHPGLQHLHTIENPKIVLYRIEIIPSPPAGSP